MSSQNQISISIPDETIQNVTTKLLECKALLEPYLQGLTAQERKDLFKMGDKTVATVLKTKLYLETNPEFCPSYMDKDEFIRDATVVNQLSPITNLTAQLYQDLDDTTMLAGSDAIQSAMLYYGQVKEAASKGILSAKPIYEDLSQRFAKNGKKKPANN